MQKAASRHNFTASTWHVNLGKGERKGDNPSALGALVKPGRRHGSPYYIQSFIHGTAGGYKALRHGARGSDGFWDTIKGVGWPKTGGCRPACPSYIQPTSKAVQKPLLWAAVPGETRGISWSDMFLMSGPLIDLDRGKEGCPEGTWVPLWNGSGQSRHAPEPDALEVHDCWVGYIVQTWYSTIGPRLLVVALLLSRAKRKKDEAKSFRKSESIWGVSSSSFFPSSPFYHLLEKTNQSTSPACL